MNKHSKNNSVFPQPRSALANILPYVSGKGDSRHIKLSSNENPLGTAPLVLSALQKQAEQLHRYPDGSASELREKLAAINSFSPNMVLVGNGSDEIIRLITQAYIDPDDCVLIPRHTFSEYKTASHIASANIAYIDMHDGQLSNSHLLELLSKNPKIIFLCHPNNPTGTTVNDLGELLIRIPRSTLVVIDQAYAEFAGNSFEDAKRYIQDLPNIIVLHTFSKLYGLASLRIGAAYAQPSIIETLYKVKMPFNIGIISQLAAHEALDDTQFKNDTIQTVLTGRTRLQKACDIHGLKYYPSEANFLCIHMKDLASPFYSFCSEEGLYIRHLASFGLPEYLRISIGTASELDHLLDLLERFLKKHSM